MQTSEDNIRCQSELIWSEAHALRVKIAA